MKTETLLVAERYARRSADLAAQRYSMMNPAYLHETHQRQKQALRFLKTAFGNNVSELKVLEIGCGTGRNLLEFVSFGFSPENITGIELLYDRATLARQIVSPQVTILQGDATLVELKECSYDIIYQAVVFSSLLDDEFQQKLANRMWSLLRPGGAILWYDFIYDNPNNNDVRGISKARIKQLFPKAVINFKKLTLAPPISRRVGPILRSLLYCFPPLRTHVLGWIRMK